MRRAPILIVGMLLTLLVPLTGCGGDSETTTVIRTEAAAGTVSTGTGADSCAADTTWDQASSRIGETLRVSGPVAGASYRPDVDREPTFINLGNDYPNPNRLTILVWGENRSHFSPPPENAYLGQNVVVSGKVTQYQGVPQVEVSSPDQIQTCPTTTPPATTTQATASTTTVANRGGGAFRMPSRNIDRYMAATYLNCEIYEADWQPSDNTSCPASAGRFVTMQGDVRPSLQCGTPDSGSSGFVLPYGDTSSRAGYSCTSASTGLTCEAGAHGFFLSKERVVTH